MLSGARQEICHWGIDAKLWWEKCYFFDLLLLKSWQARIAQKPPTKGQMVLVSEPPTGLDQYCYAPVSQICCQLRNCSWDLFNNLSLTIILCFTFLSLFVIIICTVCVCFWVCFCCMCLYKWLLFLFCVSSHPLSPKRVEKVRNKKKIMTEISSQCIYLCISDSKNKCRESQMWMLFD